MMKDVPRSTEVPTLPAIFLAFTKISMTSFGGGLTGWIMREIVGRRAWVSEEEFLSGLALAQSFPGVNVVNLSIWLGFRLRHGRGALAAVLGMIVPPMLTMLVIATAFSFVSDSRRLHVAMAGVAAAAIGLSLQTGIQAARRAMRGKVSFAVMICTFCAISVFRLPLLWVVGLMAPVSIGVAYSSIVNNKINDKANDQGNDKEQAG